MAANGGNIALASPSSMAVPQPFSATQFNITLTSNTGITRIYSTNPDTQQKQKPSVQFFSEEMLACS